MTSNYELADAAQLAEAAYAYLRDSSGNLISTAADLKNELVRIGWSVTQAADFASRYRVVDHQANTATGFSATLFERLDEQGQPTGKFVFAARGTEAFVQGSAGAPLGLDLAVDVGDLVADGLAWTQIVDMYNYWQRLSTLPGATYQRATLVQAPANAPPGTYIYDNIPLEKWRIALTPATDGLGLVASTAPVEIVGHSLGGHLASAFTRLFPGMASQAYSINGAGYAEILGSQNIQYLFSALGGAAAFAPSVVQNFFGSAGPEIVTQNAGLIQVGAHDQIFIERGGLTGNPLIDVNAVFGHSASQMADSASVYDLLIRLDQRAQAETPSQYLPRLLPIFEAADSDQGRSLEAIVESLSKLLGTSSESIATDNREALHARIKLIRNSSVFTSLAASADNLLAGKLRIDSSSKDLRARARNDFSALASLIALSPLVLTATSPANQVALAGALQDAWGQTYLDWQTDKTMSQADREAGKETFTDAWIADRAQFIAAVVAKNIKNESDTVLVNDLSVPGNTAMIDRATGRAVLGGAISSNQRAQIVFGTVGNDSLDGFGKADHLYGSAGNDTLSGQGGNDYLEGNADNDSLTGGAGNDTLLGGKGDDYLEGGADDDLLLGGQGSDTYFFGSAGWGHDVIEDSDGQGELRVPGYDGGLPVGKKVPGMTGVYRSADGAVTYALSSDGKTLTIGFDDRTDSIVIRNWQPGQLGVAFDEAPTPPEEYGSVLTDPFSAESANITVAEVPPSDGRPVAIRPMTQLDTSVAIYARDGDDMVSSVSRTMYFFVPTAQMLAQVTPDFHRDYVDGGEGNDTIYTGDGRDTVLGGAGDDEIVAGLYVPAYYEEGFHSVMPYPNYDSYFLPDGTEVVTTYMFNTGQSEADIQAIAERDFFESRREYDSNVVDAGDGDDAVYAGWGDDVVHGGIGEDVLLGQAGDDAMYGDDGADRIYGDSLSVHILQEFPAGTGGFPFIYRRVAEFFTPADLDGQDTLDGGAGDDWLWGMGANDTLLGGAGNDSLFGDTEYQPLDDEFLVPADFVPNQFHGSDYLDGGDGADQLVGGALDDRLYGGSGNDRMWGDSDKPGLTVDLHGDDTLDGGEGDDSVMGGGGSDEIIGGSGNDSIFGDDAESIVAASAHGDDTIDAGDGNDTVFGGGGSDFILGGAGDDQLAGDGGTDSTLTGNDWIDGGEGNDLIFGDGGNDWIQGGAGADSLRGGEGADTLEGGAGKDDLSGGSGNDTFRFDVGDSVVDATGFGEALRDDGGTDSIEFGAGVELNGIRVLSDGVALLAIDYSGTDRVAIDGGLGGTIESFQFADGQVLSWTELIGRVSDTSLVGQTTAGTRVAIGGKNDDSVAVAGGLGIVSGGLGNDTLSGSGGGNSYRFSLGDGSDVVTDVGGTNPSTGAPLPSSSIVFGTGIAAGDIRLSSDGTLVLNVGAGDGDQIRIVGFDANAAATATNIDRFVFADGTVLSHVDLVARGFDFSGSSANEIIQGTSLADRFAASPGNDTLRGGAGADRYEWSGVNGQDVIDDGDASASGAIDTLRVISGLNPQDIALYRSGNDLLVRERSSGTTATVINHFAGAGIEAMAFDDGTSWNTADITAHVINELTEGNDNYTGTANADLIESKGGNDTVRGGGGNDVIDGGLGNDSLLGEGGDDSLLGGAGTDTLWGGDGNDTLTDGEVMFGEAGNDTYTLTSWQASTIADSGAVGSSTDALVLPMASADVRVLRGYNSSTQGYDDVVLRANGQSGDVVVQRFFGAAASDESNKIESIRFTDGTTWSIADVFAHDLSAQTSESNDLNVIGYRWADVIDGKGGNDGLSGLQGNDTISGGAGNDVVFGNEGNDSLSGGLGSDVLYGDNGNYTQASDGNDTLEGGAGSDTLYGAGGNDTYRFGRGSDIDRVEEVGGVDRILLDSGIVQANVTLLRNGTDLIVAIDASANQLTVANHFSGAASQVESIEFADGTIWDAAAIVGRTISGTANAMVGTAGNDTFVVDNTGDTITEAPNQGTDTVQSAVNFTLGANVENLTLTGYLNATGGGNALDNLISGNVGHNDLSGGSGIDTVVGGGGNDVIRNNDVVNASDGQADSLVGGAGDDIYWVSARDADLVVENPSEGLDTINVQADWFQYSMPANVENLAATSVSFSGTVTLTGNALNNAITAYRNYGGFVLDGGAGADTLVGADPGSTFVVDNVGDVIVTSGAGAGNVDTVISSVNWTLGGALENLQLLAGATNGVGNELNNKLTGNGQGDTLTGLDGNDSLYGDIGNTYNAVGLDSLVGGKGDDQYFIDWTATSHDAVVELAGEGNDTVSVNGVARTYSLSEFANIENLVLQDASGAASLDGDGGDNRLVGNASANMLTGQGGNDNIVDDPNTGVGGNDTLMGGAGNDTLASWFGQDVIDGGSGDDAIEWDRPLATGTVVFGRGMGHDTLLASGAVASRRILFNADTQPGELQLSRVGADLALGITGTSDTLTVVGFFADGTSWLASGNVGTFEFADGFSLTTTQIAKLAEIGNFNLPTTGNDALLGGMANDTLVGLAGDDVLYGGAGDDDLTGGTGTDTLFGGVGNDVYRIAAGDGMDILRDGAGASDRVRFGAGVTPAAVNVLRSGVDLLFSLPASGDLLVVANFFASAANEIEAVEFADGTVWDNATIKDLAGKIIGTSGADTLTGSTAADRIYGMAGNDSLSGLDGDDLLDGGTGNDTLVGGLGNDTFVVDSTSDVVTEAAGQGTDTVQASVSITLASNVENLVLTGTSAINGTGNSSANTITGNVAANTLSGGTGADTLIGGAGNDIYVVDNTGDVVTELAGEGTDLVQSGANYTLAANVENLTLTGTSGLSATGNELDNVLTGNSGANSLTGGAGNDRLDGGTGNDAMAGGTGNDTYVVNVSTDVVTEQTNEGIDTIESSVTLTLTSNNVENLTLTGSNAINATGNALDNVLTGNSGTNTLTGLAGNDTYVVGTGDIVTEAAGGGTDTVMASITWTLASTTNVENLTLTGTGAINGTGNTLANVLTGNSGNNTLDGGTGTDTMIGGAGNDIYVVDNTGDVVTELAGEGTDLVQSGANYTLAANVENLTLTGTSGLSATGNELDNVLTGNSGANSLTGGAGNDRLDGGTGNDAMAGGTGNDTYVVNVSTDVVTEQTNEGIDTVESLVTLTLANNVENLTLTGSSAINATGNALDNVLTGNSGTNTLTGLAGNDTYVVGTGDTVTEAASAGTDTVMASIAWTLGSNLENLTLTGTSAITGTGNTLDNLLIGNSGANTLNGLAGNDTYDGGAGNDALTDNSTTSNDVYRWGIGSGTDTVSDSGGSDRVDVGAGIIAGQLVFTHVGNNLEVTASGISDKLIVNGWYTSTANRVEEFRLADGSSVFASQMPLSVLAPTDQLSASVESGINSERQTIQPLGAKAATVSGQEEPPISLHRWPLGMKAWIMHPLLAGERLSPEPMRQQDSVQGGFARQVQTLVTAMASFNANQAGSDAERQTIQPVHRPDPMWVSPALM